MEERQEQHQQSLCAQAIQHTPLHRTNASTVLGRYKAAEGTQ